MLWLHPPLRHKDTTSFSKFFNSRLVSSEGYFLDTLADGTYLIMADFDRHDTDEQ